MNDAIERWAGSYTAEELKRLGDQGMNGMELGDVEELSMKYNNDTIMHDLSEFVTVGNNFTIRISDINNVRISGKDVVLRCGDETHNIVFRTKTKAIEVFKQLTKDLLRPKYN